MSDGRKSTLASAASLQQKLIERAKQDHTTDTKPKAEANPAPKESRPKRAKRNNPTSKTTPKRTGTRKSRRSLAMAPGASAVPAEIQALLAKGKRGEAVAEIRAALAEDATGGHHVQTKIPAWMYRAWRVAVATDGRTSQALLMDIVLEKLLTTGAIRVEDGG